MRKLFSSVFVFAALFSFTASVFAGEIDLLVNKLVEKGILTPGEGQQLVTETKEEVRKQIASGNSPSVPSWVQNMKIKGDFRLRVQSNYPKVANDQSNVRTRGRIRLRLGIDTKVNEKITVGAGLATGLNSSTATTADSSDQIDSIRSTNQTLGDSFAKKPISLDYAYMKYDFAPWGNVIGGKFKNPLWEPSDMIWDTDINPEGASINFNKSINSKFSVFANSLIGVLDEVNSDSDDPLMYVVQPGFSYKATDRVSLRGAVAQYVFVNVKGRRLDGSAATNTRVGTNLKYGYNSVNPGMELAFRDPFKEIGLSKLGIDIPYASIYGEYVQNLTLRHNYHSKNSTGFSTGFKLGNEKVGGFGQWQFRYLYTMLEKDAIPDILPDSDRYGGKTGVRGHEWILEYGLGKNTSLSFDVYRTSIIGPKASQLPETLAQADFNFKF